MKSVKNNLLKVISVIFVLLCCVNGLSGKEITLNELEKRSKSENELSLSYFNTYFSMVKNNESQKKIEEMFAKWKKEAKTGDYYLCRFTDSVRLNVELKDNSAIVPENMANIIDGEYYIFRDATINWNGLWKGIDELVEGTHYFSNRLDLWHNLFNILVKTLCYRDLTSFMVQFLDVVSQMRKLDVPWIEINDKLLSERENYISDDIILFDTIKVYSYPMVEKYRVKDSFVLYEEIYRKAVEIFPKEPFAYNELGYAIGTRNPKEALKYFEKAYKIDKENKNFLLNCGIYSHLIKDKRKDKKYRNEIYDAKDEMLIKTYEENIKFIDDNQNQFN